MLDESVLPVLLVEVALAFSVTLWAWLRRRQRPLVFALFPFLGATWTALGHGLIFFSDGEADAGMLAGFGVVFGLFIGLPIGGAAGMVSFVLWRFLRKPTADEPRA